MLCLVLGTHPVAAQDKAPAAKSDEIQAIPAGEDMGDDNAAGEPMPPEAAQAEEPKTQMKSEAKIIVKKASDKKADKPTDSEVGAVESAPEKAPEYNVVNLQGLNKVTGRVSRLSGPIGTVMRFGNLEVIARRCWKAPPEERPEDAALLEISELKQEEGAQRIFLGWMFSSSPGLSGLEHAVYDVTVLSCEALNDPEKAGASADNADATATKKDSKTGVGPAKKDSATKKKRAHKEALPNPAPTPQQGVVIQ